MRHALDFYLAVLTRISKVTNTFIEWFQQPFERLRCNASLVLDDCHHITAMSTGPIHEMCANDTGGISGLHATSAASLDRIPCFAGTTRLRHKYFSDCPGAQKLRFERSTRSSKAPSTARILLSALCLAYWTVFQNFEDFIRFFLRPCASGCYEGRQTLVLAQIFLRVRLSFDILLNLQNF